MFFIPLYNFQFMKKQIEIKDKGFLKELAASSFRLCCGVGIWSIRFGCTNWIYRFVFMKTFLQKQKISLDQYESFYNELRENVLIIRDINFLEWVCFVANGVWIQLTFFSTYPFSCKHYSKHVRPSRASGRVWIM